MRTMFLRLLTVVVVMGWGVGGVFGQFTFDHVGGGATGSIVNNGPGSYTFEGGGEDIWSGSDSFDYAHHSFSGDFDIRVRVESLEPTARWTKAGIMARETLAQNSRMAFPRVTPAQVPTPSGGDGAGDSCFAYRTGTTAPAQGEHEDGCAGAPNFYPNNWLRLARTGSHFLGYRSTDGLNWTLMGDQDTAGWEGGAMPATVQVGLAVSRHSGPEALATAQFRNYANVNEDPATIVGQPQSVSILEGQSATFSVDMAGGFDVFTYQWQENGVNIGGATAHTYALGPQSSANSGKTYRVVVTSTRNASVVTSDPATLTVSSAPALLNASSRGTPSQIFVVFSEPVSEATGLDLSNYDVPGVDIISAAFGDNTSTVVLTASAPLALNATYMVSVFNVEDRESPANVINPNPSFDTFSHPGAGSFFSDFNSGLPAGMRVFGVTVVAPSGGVGDSGVLKLTEAANGVTGAAVIDDLNGGQPVEQFTADFKLRIGGGTCCGDRTADGLSFNFASDLPEGVYPIAEEGAGTGLSVTFDTWDNAGVDTAPAVDVVYKGVIVASQSLAGVREAGRAPATPLVNDPATGQPLPLKTGDAFVDVNVRLDPDGTVDVTYKGVLLINNVQTGYVPTAGRFGFGARTGNANDNHFVDDLSIKLYNNLGPVQFVIQPQSQSVNENQTVTFRASADGSPVISYQWQANGVNIPGAVGSVYTTVASADKNGTVYRVVASNEFSSATSQTATLTVIVDTTAPTLSSASGDISLRRVTLNFSEPVDSGTALDPFNYDLRDQGGNVILVESAAYGANQSQVILTTGQQLEGTTYTVGVAGVTDQSSQQNAVADGTQASYTTDEATPGVIAREYYGNNNFVPQQVSGGAQTDGGLGGVAVSDLENHPTYPNAPKFVCFTTLWELNTFDQAENYGARMAAFFIPKVSGPHIFYISADDGANLYMSTDADPANKVLIAREPIWNGRRDWLGTARRNAAAPENRSAPISLVAGQRYYLESVVKEGGGGDNLAVAVQQPGEGAPASGSTPITADFIADFVQNPGAALTITQQPQSTTVVENHGTTLTVAANGTSPNCGGTILTYQWQRNGVDIPGATGQSYTAPPLTLAENGTVFRAVVRLPGVRVNSADAVITVTEDTTAPVAVSASSVGGGYVGICFNETVNEADAENPANYEVNFGAVTVVSAQLRPDGQSVALGLSSEIGGNFTVEVGNIRDLKGLTMGSATLSGEVWARGRDVIGAAASNLQTAPPGTNFSCMVGDVDVVAGGADIWGTADEFHFVYQRRAGDFDVKVKLQRLDPANNWAKAGLMARETLDGNSATIEAYSTPNLPPGTATYEAGRRPNAGAETLDWGTRPVTTIPNAWIRLQRVGDTFRAMQGTDGVNWTLYAGPVIQPMTPLLYVGMATTSHNTGQATVAEYRSFMDVMFPDATIKILQRPVSQTVDENGTAVFTVVAEVTGAPASELGYQWQLSTDGGVSYQSIAGANNSTYVIDQASLSDNGKVFRVIVTVPGVAVISPAPSAQPAELTVLSDINPPRMVSATGSPTFDRVTVRFNELMDPSTSQDAFNYVVSNVVSGDIFVVEDVLAGPDARTVILLLDHTMEPGQVHAVVANGPTDLSSNEVEPDSRIEFTSFAISCGFVRVETFNDIGGGVLLSDLTNNVAYPNSPTTVRYMDRLEAPLDVADNYGVKLSGYLLPPVSGNYNFFMSADDQGAFYLSTDESPSNLQVVASEPVWNGSRDYTGTARRNAAAPENRSSTLFPAGIPLVAGQRYYFEALMKEGGGGDNLSVAWQLPGGPVPANGSLPISGGAIAVAADTVGAVITITQQPQDALVSAGSGTGATLLNVNFDSGNGGFTTANTGAVQDGGWLYGPTAGVGGNGAWYVNGTETAGAPTASALTSPTVVVGQAGPVALSFDHRYSFEYDGTRWDGGQVRLSVNGSAFGPVPNGSFTANGYDGVITGNNALDNQEGFNGDSAGYGTPGYVRSTALGSFPAGTTLAVQFLGAWDEFTRASLPNWVVDNVLIREDNSVGIATFNVAATGRITGQSNQPVFIQWERSNNGGNTWTPIPGANGTSYSTSVGAGDNGAQFRAQLYIPGATLASGVGRIVIQVNNPPSFTAGANQTVAEDSGPQSVAWASNISPGPETYEAGQVVSFEVSNNNPGLFSAQPAVSSSGVLTYTPAPNANGTAVVTVVARDNGGSAFGGNDTSSAQTFTITVTPVADCPTAGSQTVAVAEDGSVAIVLTGTNPEGGALVYTVVSGPAHGSLSGTAPNLTYTPAANYCGPDGFTFTVGGGAGCGPATGTVTINVSCENDCPNPVIAVVPPVVVGSGGTNYMVIATGDGSALVLFSGSQSWDPEGDNLSYLWYEGALPPGTVTPTPPGQTGGHTNTKGKGHQKGKGHGHDGDGDGEEEPGNPAITNDVLFGDDVVAERELSVGLHLIGLTVGDGTCSNSTTVLVEVISAGRAIENCIALLESLNLERKNSRSLVEALKKAGDQFDKGHTGEGVEKLEAFMRKVQGDKKIPAAAKAALIDCAQDIIDAVEP